MSKEQRCPSCGHLNEAPATACANCNFPLGPETAAPAGAGAPPAATPEPIEPSVRGFDPSIRRVRPLRPRPPRGPQQQLQMQLWAVLGGVAILIILFTAFQGFKKNNVSAPEVAGAMQEQQHIVDMSRGELAKDSTNINARIALANVLYDTGNWSEAIIHYKSALRTDPDRIETIVDLGVCYYNLSDADDAIALFERAIQLDPNHPIALFNLGIVSEGQDKLDTALKYYRRAQQSHPPEPMAQPLQQAIERVTQKLGRPAAGTQSPGGGTR